MLYSKRTLFLAATLAASSLMFVVANYDTNDANAESQASKTTLRSKILRRKDRLNQKLSAYEKAVLRKQATLKEERQLEDKIPNHLPIKVKIRAEKEKNFKDIDNSHWARDFELEVKNTGTKPIYRLVLLLKLPEPEIDGGNIVFPLTYGRTGLSMFQEPLESAKPEDVPIRPGETYIFNIPDGQIRAWTDIQKNEGLPNPKKLVIKFQDLSFGNGTGFRWGEGVAWPGITPAVHRPLFTT